MTAITATKKVRMFEEKRMTLSCSKGDEKCQSLDHRDGNKHIVDVVARRATILEARPRESAPCRICKRPMLVSEGQIALFHATCRPMRKERRFIIKRS